MYTWFSDSVHYLLLSYLFCAFLWSYPGSVIIMSLQNIIKTEGLRGMYRGLSPTLIALLPNWAVSILLYLVPLNEGFGKPQLMIVGKFVCCLLSLTIALAF